MNREIPELRLTIPVGSAFVTGFPMHPKAVTGEHSRVVFGQRNLSGDTFSIDQDNFDHDKGQKSAISGCRLH